MDTLEATEIAAILIKHWEGCKLTAYPDPDTGGAPWTIGYGATGTGISEGTVWTQEQADNALTLRLAVLCNEICPHITFAVTSEELGAMLSLAYNIGVTAFLNSSLLTFINAGNVKDAADQFLLWDHDNGKVIDGLLNRREDERRVFLGGSP
jgi:lysozyme